MKIFKSTIIALAFIIHMNVFCQNKSYDTYDNFIGKFHIFSSDKKVKEDILQIIKKEDKFYFKLKKSSNTRFHELTKISLDDFKSDFHKSLPETTLILGDNKDLYIYFIPTINKKNRDSEHTNYFVMSVIGPIDIYKTD